MTGTELHNTIDLVLFLSNIYMHLLRTTIILHSPCICFHIINLFVSYCISSHPPPTALLHDSGIISLDCSTLPLSLSILLYHTNTDDKSNIY